MNSIAYETAQLDAAYSQFTKRYPTYQKTHALDEMRQSEYARLDNNGQIYLDFTGGGLYAASQIKTHMALLNEHVLGNPHSRNPTSMAMTDLVESARSAIFEYFNASRDEYVVVFTQNATGALKLVGESYPFTAGGQYLMSFDNHNSVNGIREFANKKGARVNYVPLTTPDLRLNAEQLQAFLQGVDKSKNNLFAYPAQSNFSGVKHPLELIASAQEQGWDVLLDSAAFVPSNRLDLEQYKPDFVPVSFYKMFGYPTGIGCLLMRKTVLPKLHRPWFAGGTVNFATVQGKGHVLTPFEAGFEDGTVNYLNIPAVQIGLRHIASIGIDVINERVRCLTGWLLSELLDLKHSNGKSLIRLYGPATTEQRGGSITMNFYDDKGHLLDYQRIEELAGLENISLRTGCFCNPGAGEIAEGLNKQDMLDGLHEGNDITLASFVKTLQHRGNKSVGAVRISVGLASNFADVYKFMQFAASLRDSDMQKLGKVNFDIEGCRVIRDGS